jgi:putative hydrolase of the HAD superfamily
VSPPVDTHSHFGRSDGLSASIDAEIQGVIFDLDGVVRLFDDHPDWYPIRAVAFEPTLLEQAVTGIITDEQWRDIVAATVPAELRAATNRWRQRAGIIDVQVLALVRQLRQRVPVGLLSNGTTRLRHDLSLLEVAHEFDVIINSAEIGVAKPNPRAFTLAATALGTPLALTLMIDDRPENVEGAIQTGLLGHHYTSYDELVATLQRYRLIPND